MTRTNHLYDRRQTSFTAYDGWSEAELLYGFMCICRAFKLTNERWHLGASYMQKQLNRMKDDT